jgi:hypothetical protein
MRTIDEYSLLTSINLSVNKKLFNFYYGAFFHLKKEKEQKIIQTGPFFNISILRFFSIGLTSDWISNQLYLKTQINPSLESPDFN